MFAQFYKDRQVWAGLALYHEVDSLAGHSRATRAAMDHGPASWADTVTDAAGKPLSQSCTSIWSTVDPLRTGIGRRRFVRCVNESPRAPAAADTGSRDTKRS